MNSNNSINHIKPDLQSWMIAGISLIGVFFFNYIAVTELEKTRKEIKISVLEEDYYSSAEADKTMVSDISNATQPRGLAAHFSVNKNSSQLKLLKDMEFNLKNAEIKDALNNLSELDKNFPLKKNDTSELLKSHLQKISLLKNKKLEISKQKSETLRAQEEIKISYQNLKNELLIFFGLSEESDTVDSLLFYDSGVLQSLPRLKAFKEPIENIQQFSETLSAAGGKISIEEGVDPQQFFQEKLSELSDRSFSLMLTYEKYSEKILLIEDQYLKAEAEYSSEYSLTLRLLNEVALKYAKNQNLNS